MLILQLQQFIYIYILITVIFTLLITLGVHQLFCSLITSHFQVVIATSTELSVT